MSSKSSHGDEGFTIIELLIACGIATTVLTVAFLSLRLMIHALNAPMAASNDANAMNLLEQQLRADASVATAVEVPADASGTASEIEFWQLDADHQWHTWSYKLGNGLSRLQAGGSHVLDQKITAFQARFIPAGQLAAGGNAGAVFAEIAAPQTQTVTVQGRAVTNGIAEIRMTRGALTRTVQIASASAPTGFSVENGPLWHAVLSRTSTTKRIFLVGQKTFYTINGTVTYSFDKWATSRRWCQYAIYDGLRNGDPVAEMNTPDETESSKAIFAGCRRVTGQRQLPATPPAGASVQ